MSDQTKTSRTDFIKQIVVLPAAAAAIAASAAAADAAKSSQAQLKYQNHPMGAKKCSGCSLYIAGKNPKANGQCKVVAGSISPNGYCIAYQKK